MLLRHASLCLAVLILSCGNGKPQQSPEPSTCSTLELRAWLDDVRADGLEPTVIYPRILELPTLGSDRGPVLGPFILVRVDAISIDGEFIADPATLDGESRSYLRERLALVNNAPVTLGVDARVPWGQVVPVLDAAREAGRRSLELLGRRSYRARPPGPSSLDQQVEEVAGFDESLRAHRVRTAGWHEQIYARCSPAHALFETKTGDLAATLDALPDAIARCDCAVEMAAVEAHVWGLAGRIERPARLVVAEVELAGEERVESTEISLGPDTPWSDAIEQLAAAGTAIRVSVKNARREGGSE